MKKWQFVLLALFFVPLFVRAQEIAIIPRDTTVKGNVLKTGQRVDVDGTVDGDAIIFGGDVTVAGKVNGDLIVAAQTLTVTGSVTGSIRAAGQTVTLSGSVGRNVTVAGQAVTLKSGATVKGSVAVASSSLTFQASVDGRLDAATGNAVIAGSVKQDVRVRDSSSNVVDTQVTKDANIGGQFIHTGGAKASVESGAKIGAGVVEHLVSPPPNPLVHFWRVWSVVSFLGLVFVGLLTLWLFKREVHEIMGALRERKLRSFVVGILVFFLAPPAALLLALTLVGLPLSLILVASYVLVLYVSKFILSLFVGAWLVAWAKKHSVRLPESQRATFIIGLLALTIVFDLILHWPLAGRVGRIVSATGGIVYALLTFWAVGAIVLGKWKVLRSQS